MPAKNTTRHYDAPAFYHVYNRGAGKQPIYIDIQDKDVFLHLLKRYGAHTADQDSRYPTYDIQVVAYCLMNSHFHLLLYQYEDAEAITGYMRSVSTAYTMYFNQRYRASGHLFQSVYKASHITNEAYLAHITRYIHLNPRTYKSYRYSSIHAYLNDGDDILVNPNLATTMTPSQYLRFLEDYTDKRHLRDEIKSYLAF